MSPSELKRGLRSDAERNMEVILQAAAVTLGNRSDASMEDIAKAAGLARQTVYAHFASRDLLIQAVQQRVMDQAIALLDAARLDDDPPDTALERLLDATWTTASEHQIFDLPSVPTTPEGELQVHQPLIERLEALVMRGQQEGVFDTRLPGSWLAAAFIGLAHVAGEEVKAGRMQNRDAFRALKRSVWRLYGVDR